MLDPDQDPDSDPDLLKFPIMFLFSNTDFFT